MIHWPRIETVERGMVLLGNLPIVGINGKYANVTATIQFLVQESVNTSA